MADQSDIAKANNNHDAEMRRAAQLTQDQQRMALAKQMEEKAIVDKRMAEEKIAEEKRLEEQKNGKKGDLLDDMVMAGATGLLLFTGWEATKDGLKNMMDPKMANDLSKQDPHAEVALYGAATPSGLAGGIPSLFGNTLSQGQTSSSLNQVKKDNSLNLGMSLTMT
jgi:hypothetical protein